MALPWRTVACGLPRASSETVTTGLLAGGGGGSETSAVTVPASSTKRKPHRAARDLDAPGPAGTGQRHHRRRAALGEAVRDGERGERPVPRVGAGAAAGGDRERVRGVAGVVPARLVVGLADGGRNRVLQRLRLHGDGGAPVAGQAHLNRPGRLHHAASPAGSPSVTVTLRSRTAMSTARSWGMNQKSSRATASAMEVRRASSSETRSRVAMCSASVVEVGALPLPRVGVRVVAGREEARAHELGERPGLQGAVRGHERQGVVHPGPRVAREGEVGRAGRGCVPVPRPAGRRGSRRSHRGAAGAVCRARPSVPARG